MKYPKKSNTKKYLLTLLAVLLIAGGVFAYYALNNEEEASQQDESSINFDPPTEEEQRAGDEQKDQIIKEEEAEADDESAQPEDQSKKQANVIITDASQYDDIIEVRAFISNHVQEGVCKYIFSKDNQTITKEQPAYPDASTTVCPTLEVPRSEFPSGGDWQLVVSYESADAKGTSETKTIRVN